jgi:hypothetical protein
VLNWAKGARAQRGSRGCTPRVLRRVGLVDERQRPTDKLTEPPSDGPRLAHFNPLSELEDFAARKQHVYRARFPRLAWPNGERVAFVLVAGKWLHAAARSTGGLPRRAACWIRRQGSVCDVIRSAAPSTREHQRAACSEPHQKYKRANVGRAYCDGDGSGRLRWFGGSGDGPAPRQES